CASTDALHRTLVRADTLVPRAEAALALGLAIGGGSVAARAALAARLAPITVPGVALAPVPLTVRVLALALRVAALAAGIARRLHRLGQVAHQLAEILGQRHRFGPGPRHALDVAHISAFVGGDEADRL